MRIGSPKTLWRATFADLAKLVLLSSSVLVIIVSVALAIKPLSDGYLSAWDAVRFIAFLIPPGLAYALPFGAGFAATLVYHRITADREAIAAYAGGISHRALLAPAMVVGVLLLGLMVLLTQEIIPRFLQSAQRIVAFNAARYIKAEIDKGQAVGFDQIQIFADACLPMKPPPGSGATDVLRLDRFAAVELGREGTPVTEITAARAFLWLFPPVEVDDGVSGPAQTSSRIVMRLENVVAVQQGQGLVGFRDKVDLSWTVPNTFRDSPKYLPGSELARLRENPTRMNWMEQRRRGLALAMAQVQMLEAAAWTLNSGGAITLADARGEPVVLSGARARREGTVLRLNPAPEGLISLQLNRDAADASNPSRRESLLVTAPSGDLEVAAGQDPRSPRLTTRLTLSQVTARRADGEAINLPSAQLSAFDAPDLTFRDDPSEKLLAASIDELLEQTKAQAIPVDARGGDAEREIGARPEPLIARARHEVARKLDDLEKDILSKTHERWSMSVSAFVMVITGAIAALRFLNRRVLGVYLWTFVPALATLTTIGGGSPMVGSFGAPGLILMWSGVVLLVVYTFVMYRGLAKH
jgi:lipopolysaccharide export LptBFGC system permease protein LptF